MIKVSSIKWQQVLEDLNMLRAFFLKIVLSVYPGFSKELGIAMFLLAKRIIRMRKKSGALFVCLYLKHAATCLMKYYGGDPVVTSSFFIRLTRTGLPCIIPSFHRKMIRRRDEKADRLVKLYLSLFTVTKIIPLCTRVSRKTFHSIVTPLTEEQERSVSTFTELFVMDLPELLSRYLPNLATLPLFQGIVWKPSWKTLPNYRIYKAMRMELSPYICQTAELKSFGSLLRYIHAIGQQFSPLILWLERTRFAFDKDNDAFCLKDLKEIEDKIAPYPVNCEPQRLRAYRLGRLGQACVGGAKRRIFAIGNSICQSLLKPVHNWLMDVLKMIPSDGTFNQSKPIERLRGATFISSVDLSAATDRFPLRLLFHVMEAMFGSNFASGVVNSTLACHTFSCEGSLSFSRKYKREPVATKRMWFPNLVSFVVGQPLGLYSSWPLFALTHHCVVWWAANRVYPGKVFKGYGLLGDDIVITDRSVAAAYKAAIQMLAVEVSALKSLTSDNGSCEFAKQFWTNNIQTNLSPISMKMMLGVHNPRGLAAFGVKYPNLSLKQLLSIHGLGFKAKARIFSGKISLSRKRLLTTLTRFSSPLKIWLEGLSMDPTTLGLFMDFAFQRLKPKEFKIAPDHLVKESDTAKCQSLVEITLYKGAMEDYLQYLKQYWLLYNQAYFLGRDPWSVLEDLCNLKPVYTDWKVSKVDLEMVRFGVLFKMYDMRDRVLKTLPTQPSHVLPEIIYLGVGNTHLDDTPRVT